MTEIRLASPDPGHAYPASLASARRRYLTIVFSDLSGSTKLAGGMEAEDYALLLDQVRQAYQEVIPQYGGTIVQISGDGLLAIFGYPDTSERDARVATMAAVELHARVRSSDAACQSPACGLRLHTGIHSGLVLVHEGDAVRGRFELLGSATNIASRLANAAESDEILVSEATLGPDRHMFQTSERLYLSLKGKEKPIAAFRVLDRAHSNTQYVAREGNRLSPFVGRREELRQLETCLGRAQAGDPRIVGIAGPPGVGKTRLVDELLRRAGSHFQIYRGECDSHLGAEPLQPFLQILRSVFGLTRPAHATQSAEAFEASLRNLGPELLAHAPTLLPLASPAEGGAGEKRRPSAEAVTAALRALFSRLAETKPLAVVIDDWQWADDASRRVLEGMRDLEGLPLLFILTMRSHFGGGSGLESAELIFLTPFTDEEASTAIRHVLPGADPFVVDEICTAAGGNPLFIEELCHSVAYGEEDLRSHAGSGWLDILIESRFARLPDAQAELLRTAAVIGKVIPVWLLELTTGRGEEDALVRGLADEDFIFPGVREGTLRFKHGIARDVIYDSVGLRERRALHLRIAEALRQHGSRAGEDELYDALAYHYGAGGDAAATAHYAELAGDKAIAASALDRAQAHYRAALNALDCLPPSDASSQRWSRIVHCFGLASVFDPSRDQLPVFRQALERAAAGGDQTALARAGYWLACLYYALGEPRKAIAHCESSLDVARGLDDRFEVQIKATLGQARAAAGDYEGALALLDEVIRIKGRHRSRGLWPANFAYSLACRGSVLGDLGRFGEAQACFEEAMEAVQGANHEVEGSVLTLRSAVCLWQGRWDAAEQLAASAERVSARVRTRYLYAMSRALAGYARWMRDRTPEALQAIVEATSWLEASDRNQFTSLNHGWLAEAMIANGRVVEARRHAAQALLRARKGDRLGEAMACRAMARAAARGHGRKSAAHYLGCAMAAARARNARHEIAVNRLCEAELALQSGDRERGLALLERIRPEFEAMEMHWHAREAARLHEAAGRSALSSAAQEAF